MDIKAFREKWGISQESLANVSGIPRDRIAKWEQGKGSPKHEDTMQLLSIEATFRFVTDRALKGKGEQLPNNDKTLGTFGEDVKNIDRHSLEYIQELKDDKQFFKRMYEDKIKPLETNLADVLKNQELMQRQISVAFQLISEAVVLDKDKREAILNEFDRLTFAERD